MSTNDALRALVELPGLGPWSASLVLLRGYLYFYSLGSSLLGKRLIHTAPRSVVRE